MLANLAWFAGGLVARIVGAEALVRGGSRLASRLGIRPIIAGLTVLSIGTSMPELAVGVVAATEGNGSLAVGNIAGTNMVNLLLILGLSALILPLAIQMQTLRFDLPVIAAAASLVPAHGLVLDPSWCVSISRSWWSPRWRVFRSSSRAAGSAASRVAR